MRSLTVTLLVVILISVPGFGWLLSSAYQKFKEPDSHSDLYQKVVQQYTQAINAIGNTDSLNHQWENDRQLAVLLTPDSIPITIEPDTVKYSSLEYPKFITSESGTSIVTHLDRHGLNLVFGPVSAAESSSLSNAKNAKLRNVLTILYYSVIAAVVWLCLVPLFRRLGALRAATHRFGVGDLQSRIEPGAISYTKDIEHGFNHMAQRIQTLVEDNKMLSSAVSHDLRTPLNRLRLRFDILADAEQSGLLDEDISSINNNLDTMESLIKSMLEFSRLEHRLESSVKAALNPHSLLVDCVDNQTLPSIRLELESADENISVVGNSKYLEILFSNLINNAVKYAKTSVVVTIKQQGIYTLITVADDGPGIDKALREEVVKPFIRGEGAASMSTAPGNDTGYGLGMSVANRIARWHGSEIQITSSARLGGAEISVSLPISE